MTTSAIEPATFRLVAQWQIRRRLPPYSTKMFRNIESLLGHTRGSTFI